MLTQKSSRDRDRLEELGQCQEATEDPFLLGEPESEEPLAELCFTCYHTV